MEIVNIRIDERLIHGQVAAVWTRFLGTTRIMVIDDEASGDKLLKMALKLAVPANVNLSVLSVLKASERLLEKDAYLNEKIFIIVKGPKTLVDLSKVGVQFKQINVGNISKKMNSIQIKQSVSITREEKSDFQALMNLGVHFVSQMVPSEESIEFAPLIEKAKI